MKKAEAESLHRYLISEWLRDVKPEKDQHGLLDFWQYLEFAKAKQPGCMDFRCTAGPHYEVERWFDDILGQNWSR